MPHFARFILALFILICSVMPARASEYVDMDICLGKQVVARILCKDVIEVNYVSRVRPNLYLYSVFYASREARFFVGVYNDMIRVQGKEFQTITRSIPYHFDEVAKCAVVDYSVPDCPTTERIVCCSQKTVEEQLDEKFWDRPIPELLDEDLKNALEADKNEQKGDGEEGEQSDGGGDTPEQ